MPNFKKTKLASFFITRAKSIDRCVEWPYLNPKEREAEYKHLGNAIEALANRGLKDQGIQQHAHITWINAVEENQHVTITLHLTYDQDAVSHDQVEEVKCLVNRTLTHVGDTINKAHAILGENTSTATLVKGKTFHIEKSLNTIIMPQGPLTLLKAIRRAQSQKIGVELSNGETCELDVPPIHPPVEDPETTYHVAGALVNGVRDTSMCASILQPGKKPELKLSFAKEHRQRLIQAQELYARVSISYKPIFSFKEGRKKPIGGSILDVQVDQSQGGLQGSLPFGMD
ncbi:MULTISPECIES: hypothetical protein [unclassified Ectothiorhodospira]|uniref:hypothetical protein n=1 Tax=unclassified Ectothiorhodospira TaxID=2684909 RepID=UPI001EE8FCF5|nr:MULTISPECIES: hypothetical protein [unclassified Ectothiorhodospira]MCG5517346.1 hypothetical protein [Ectothiorhodospira sp. 9100]MCG5519946.1 hypothetical protein [Ectothiorhodospira sp. 9905]